MGEQVPELKLEFAGEWITLDPARAFVIGREGDLTVDDNQYLHRQFLENRNQDGLWWLSNLGSRLSATISSGGGARSTTKLRVTKSITFALTSQRFLRGQLRVACSQVS